MNPHLSVEKFGAIWLITVLGPLAGLLARSPQRMSIRPHEPVFLASWAPWSCCQALGVLAGEQPIPCNTDVLSCILHSLCVWQNPGLRLGSLASQLKLSVSNLTHLTWFHECLPDRALRVPELLSAPRTNVEGEQGGPSSSPLPPSFPPARLPLQSSELSLSHWLRPGSLQWCLSFCALHFLHRTRATFRSFLDYAILSSTF